MAGTPSRRGQGRNTRVAFGFLYSFIGLAVLFLCFFSIRLLREEAAKGLERSIPLPEQRIGLDSSAPPPPEVLNHADGLENKACRVRTDANGFLLPSGEHAHPDLTIVFLGGSTTECRFMPEQQRFPFLVGRNLESSLALRVNSHNGGNAGNTSLHDLLLLQTKVLPLRPRFVVLMENLTDLMFLAQHGEYHSPSAMRALVRTEARAKPMDWLIGLIAAGKTAAGQSPLAQVDTAVPPSAQVFSDQFRKNLELFIFLCRQNGSTPVLMTQANRLVEPLAPNLAAQLQPVYESRRIAPAQFLVIYAALNETVRQVAKERQVLLIDLDRLIPKTAANMYDVVHLNAEGSRLVSEHVAQALAQDLAKQGQRP